MKMSTQKGNLCSCKKHAFSPIFAFSVTKYGRTSMEFINESSLIKFTNGIVSNEAICNMYHSLVRQNSLTQKSK